MTRKKLIRISTIPITLQILLRGQLRYMTQFYDVIGVSSPGSELEAVSTAEGIRTVAIPMTRQITPFQDLVSIMRMCRLFLRERPYIVHSHTPKAGLIAMLAGFLTRVPHRLHTVAGLPVMEATGLRQQVLLGVEKLTYACATQVFPNSFGLEAYIKNHGLCPAKKMHVIGHGSSNGIDTEWFERTPELINAGKTLRELYGFSPSDIVLCFIGRLVEDKGLTELVHAYRALKRPEVKLLLVGPLEPDVYPLPEDCLQAIKEDAGIISVGFQADVRPFLAASDLFIFPSYREGFPNALLQAACMELPCIATDINGCNEILQHMETGILIPPKSKRALRKAIELLLTDVTLRNHFSKKARTLIINNYDHTTILKALHCTYEKLLNPS